MFRIKNNSTLHSYIVKRLNLDDWRYRWFNVIGGKDLKEIEILKLSVKLFNELRNLYEYVHLFCLAQHTALNTIFSIYNILNSLVFCTDKLQLQSVQLGIAKALDTTCLGFWNNLEVDYYYIRLCQVRVLNLLSLRYSS